MNENGQRESIYNYPATMRRSINGKFLSIDEIFVEDINKEIANTVLARYWKGIEADNSNCVVVKYE